MDADDEWWKTHLAYRPDHAKFRNGPPTNLEQHDVMFRKAHVTGESVAILGEQEARDDMEGAILLDDDGEATKKTTLGKRKVGAGEKEKESPFYKAYNTALSNLVSRVDAQSSCAKDDSIPTMKNFLAMVRKCGVTKGTAIMFTTSKLAVKREYRELLAAFETCEGRLDYLRRTHNERNK
ncbi:hypothetical protein ACQ4PT_067125 [Festuca glaucescens]